MKTAAVLIVTVLVSAMCFSVEPQTSPKPLLVDEHPVLPCDESLARLDNFFSELQNDLGSNGFIVISNKAEGRQNSVFRQALIEGYARFRNFDSSRLKIVRSNSNEDMKIQLWRVPLGATEPSIERIDMSNIIPATVKAFIFTRDEAWDDGICPGINERRILVEFLR